MSDTIDKMEQIKALKNGQGIQYLLNEAYKIFGNPIVMFNTEYNLVMHTDVVTDDPLWNEIIEHGSFSIETQNFFKNEYFTDTVANARTVTFLNSDQLKYNRILGKLYNENYVHVANLVMVACNKPFEEDVLEAFEEFCKMLTQASIHGEFYKAYGKIYQETLINKLIDGRIEDKQLYSAHIAILYNGLKTNLYLAVADISKHNPDYTMLPYFRDLFLETQPAFKYSIYSNYVLIIISTDEPLNAKADLSKLLRLWEQNNIYVGISGCFDNLYELRTHYTQAVQALNYGKEDATGRHIFLYDDFK